MFTGDREQYILIEPLPVFSYPVETEHGCSSIRLKPSLCCPVNAFFYVDFNTSRHQAYLRQTFVLQNEKLLNLYKDNPKKLLSTILDNASGQEDMTKIADLIRDEKSFRLIMDKYPPCESLSWFKTREALEETIFTWSPLPSAFCMRLIDSEPRHVALRLAGYMASNPNINFIVKWKIVNMSERPTLRPFERIGYVDGMYYGEAITMMISYLWRGLDKRKTDPASCTDVELSDMVTIIMKRALNNTH